MGAVLLAVLASAVAAGPKDAKKELDRLQGTWVMESLEIDGQVLPEDKIKGTTLVIKGDRYIVKVKDQSFETTFKLDPAKKPKAIDMYFATSPAEAPKLAKGIYELDGDTLKLCRYQAPEKARPTQFGSWPDTGLFVVVWKRQKK